MTYEVSYRFAAVQHRIIDPNKTDTGIGSIDTLVSVSPITTQDPLTLDPGEPQSDEPDPHTPT